MSDDVVDVEDGGEDLTRVQRVVEGTAWRVVLPDVVALVVLLVGAWGLIDRDLQLLMWHLLAVLGALWLVPRVSRRWET